MPTDFSLHQSINLNPTHYTLNIKYNTLFEPPAHNLFNMPINWWTVGSLYGAASVAFGAFGAHGLKSRGISDAKIASWGTAAHYQVG